MASRASSADFETKPPESQACTLVSLCFASVMRLVLRDGMPVRVGDKETWRAAKTRQRNAEGALLACVSAAASALLTKHPAAGTADCLPDNRAGRSLMERLEITHGRPVRACLAALRLSEQRLFGQHLNRTNLSGADLSGAKGLTKEQLQSAKGSAETKLPEGLVRPAHWDERA